MTLIEELAQHIHNQGIGSLATNLFRNYLPDSPDIAMCVIDTGGTQPDEYLPTKEPTFQVYIRNTTYSAGKTKLDAIRSAFHQQQNVSLINGETFFYFIMAISEGGYLGRDERGRDLFSINFRCRTR